MSEAAIQVDRLGKRYRIPPLKAPPRTRREAVARRLRAPFQYLRSMFREPTPEETLWALRDVSFEVARGEVLGVIGRNGAGKSTLLKILSRITEPTEGAADIRGRVGSLLEVGTGFHPELTGRENTYLSGAILGMKKAEIDRKFDEIVEFAGIERFLDTPVKRYSSGMYVRLAFAVAAHLDPEILLVDEVLAVGDVAFQKKCLGKMDDVTKQGRTVLFVSHNMNAVMALCSRAILLADGRCTAEGPADAVVQEYLAGCAETLASAYTCDEPPNDVAWVQAAELKSEGGSSTGSFLMTDPMVVECQFRVAASTKPALSVQIKEMNNSPVFHFPCLDESFALPSSVGTHRVRARIPPLNLYPGNYLIRLTLTDMVGTSCRTLHVVESLQFEVRHDHDLVPRSLGRTSGLIFARAQWQTVESDRDERGGPVT